jgi:hypothetical protein
MAEPDPPPPTAAIAADYLDDHCPRAELAAAVRVATYLVAHPEVGLTHLLIAAAEFALADHHNGLADAIRATHQAMSSTGPRGGVAWTHARPWIPETRATFQPGATCETHHHRRSTIARNPTRRPHEPTGTDP